MLVTGGCSDTTTLEELPRCLSPAAFSVGSSAPAPLTRSPAAQAHTVFAAFIFAVAIYMLVRSLGLM